MFRVTRFFFYNSDNGSNKNEMLTSSIFCLLYYSVIRDFFFSISMFNADNFTEVV